MFQFWLVVLALCGLSQANFTENCMQCICEAEGCEDNIGTCRNEGGVIYCGPYNINEPYYIDCGTPGADWISCTTQMECSETCVVAYMDRYGEFCTGGVTPVCEDYARIHHGGPNGCNSDTTDDYWEVVSACCSSVGGCD